MSSAFDDGPDAVAPTSEVSMSQFFKRMLGVLFGLRREPAWSDEPKSETQVLREKIQKWEGQADEYEAMGLSELARRSREGVVWYRRKLMALESPTLRRAA